MRVRFDDAELSVATTGTGRADMKLAGYIAAATLAAAEARPPPRAVARRERVLREQLVELADTRRELIRVGVLLNQAVKVANATGTPPPGLSYLAGLVERALRHVDERTVSVLDRDEPE